MDLDSDSDFADLENKFEESSLLDGINTLKGANTLKDITNKNPKKFTEDINNRKEGFHNKINISNEDINSKEWDRGVRYYSNVRDDNKTIDDKYRWSLSENKSIVSPQIEYSKNEKINIINDSLNDRLMCDNAIRTESPSICLNQIQSEMDRLRQTHRQVLEIKSKILKIIEREIEHIRKEYEMKESETIKRIEAEYKAKIEEINMENEKRWKEKYGKKIREELEDEIRQKMELEMRKEFERVYDDKLKKEFENYKTNVKNKIQIYKTEMKRKYEEELRKKIDAIKLKIYGRNN